MLFDISVVDSPPNDEIPLKRSRSLPPTSVQKVFLVSKVGGSFMGKLEGCMQKLWRTNPLVEQTHLAPTVENQENQC